jgi:filamentous hemagglutinin family protein
MNKVYRSIWNSKTGTFVAVSENTSASGKKLSAGASDVSASARFCLKAVAASLLLVFGANVYALPAGGVVAAGTATVVGGVNATTITQSTQNTVINWQSFNVARGESVRFVQPNAGSVALNRVLGADPSSILGNMSANGRVFLVNPNGILFGQGASINVGGLVASTLNISDANFMAANYKFEGAGNGTIVNQGSINAAGGYVALLGASVSNQGLIAARLGTVVMAAGNAVTLDVAGDGLLNVTVNEGKVNALVANGGAIIADGGRILMTAIAAGELLGTVVNNTGLVQAQTIDQRSGTIKLLADTQSGTVNVGGTLDASAPNGGNGGFIDTSAAQVKIASDTKVTTSAALGQTGNWLIDPTDFTIAAGSGAQTGSGIGADTLSSNLADSNINIATVASGLEHGDIHVNNAVSWSTNALTLTAHGDININASLNGSGTAKLALEFGQGAVAAGNTSTVKVNAPVNLAAGNNFSKKLGSDGALVTYTLITSLGALDSTTGTDLQGMSGNLAGHYALGADIDASATSAWNAGAGFAPIGNSVSPFAGTFDGLGHTISGVFINRPSATYVGPFGFIGSTAEIGNAGLTGVNITGMNYVGGLVGFNNGGSISKSYATGRVVGALYTGGLVGVHKGSITDSYATASVNGSDIGPGGLVGYSIGSISNSYATGPVAGGSFYSGGLVGVNRGHISNSYATGTVNGAMHGAGGLVGVNGQAVGDNASISNSYATGAVSGGQNDVGGLVGATYVNISNSYATGTVSGSAQDVGGLVGIQYGGSISQSYAAGAVNGPNAPGSIGGLVGRKNAGTNNSSFWDSYSTGQAGGVGGVTDAGVAAVTSNPTQSAASNYAFKQGAYPGLDFTNTWVIYNTYTKPLLRSLMTALTVTATGAAKTYDGAAFGGGNGVTYSAATDGNLLGTLSYGGTSQGATNAGSYSIIGSGLYSNQRGYIISYIDGALTVNKASLALGGTRAYDGTSTVAGSVLTATGVAGQTFTVIGAGDTTNLASKNVQTGSTLGSVTGLALGASGNGGTSSNYNALSTTGSAVSVTRVDLTLATSNVSKTYDGSLTAAGTATVTSGTLFGSDALSGGSFAFSDKNAGSNKAVITTGVTLADGNSGGNYNVSYANNTTSTISKANLALGGTRAYDGTSTVAGSVLTATGGAGETFTVIGAGDTSNLASKNVQTGSTLASLTGLALGASGNGGTSSNYNALSTTGSAVSVTRADLTLATSNVSKTYDGGLTAAGTATITSGTLFGSDALSGGSFAFSDKNAGSNKTVITTGVTLADGNGGGNYNVSYANNTTSTVTTKAVTISGMTAENKVYDGSTAAVLNGGTLNGLVGNETLALSGQTGAFADKNVGTAKAVAVSGATLANGTGLASNYSVSNPAGLSADITRLTSVAWVGGVSGNWFNPANWAGGAVPDLANVANVLIPAGVIVSFANGSAVSVDTIGTGGSLSMVDGRLTVAGSLQLVDLAQSGGTLNSGTIDVGSFRQSGGSLVSLGGLTVRNAYSQTGIDGTVNAGGNVAITQTSGSALLGNITTAGTLDVNAVTGDITQLAGTSIDTAGTTTLSAANGGVTLANSGNRLGTSIISGASITRFLNAIASAISMGSDKVSNGGSDHADDVFSTPGAAPRLNLTVIGGGIRLPPDGQIRKENDTAVK